MYIYLLVAVFAILGFLFMIKVKPKLDAGKNRSFITEFPNNPYDDNDSDTSKKMGDMITNVRLTGATDYYHYDCPQYHAKYITENEQLYLMRVAIKGRPDAVIAVNGAKKALGWIPRPLSRQIADHIDDGYAVLARVRRVEVLEQDDFIKAVLDKETVVYERLDPPLEFEQVREIYLDIQMYNIIRPNQIKE